MKVTVLLVLLSVTLALGDRFTPGEYQASFSQWMGRHSKSYSSDDFGHRFNVYKSNMDFVDTFNQRNNTFTVALNHFADLTTEEFSALLFRPIPARPHAAEAEAFTGDGARTARGASLDWRTKGAVTAIKNQGQCGSCWTFAAAGSIESAYQISGGALTAFSEQNLLDCVTTSNGCNGGSFVGAFQYVISNGGIDTMASYPYTAAQGTCKYSAANLGATITSYRNVAANNEGALMAAVNMQPVAVSIQGNLQSFQLYHSGTYNDANCTSATLNHAVIVIGYGTDANGTDYWLIRNSWGTSWGQSGYAQLKRNVNMCGLAAQPAFPSRQNTKGFIYQDYFFAGWSLMYSGSVSSISTYSTGNTGYGITATIGANSRLMVKSSPAFSTVGYKSINFDVVTSASCTLKYDLGSTSQSTATTTTYKTVSTLLSSLGSVGSVTYLSMTNTGAASCTFTFDNLYFSA